MDARKRGTIWAGENNPLATWTGDGKNSKPLYQLKPINELDEVGFVHDRAYDLVDGKGPDAASEDWGTIWADEALVNTSRKLVKAADVRFDNISGQNIDQTFALDMAVVFTYFVNSKIDACSRFMEEYYPEEAEDASHG